MTEKTDVVATYVREHVQWDRGPSRAVNLNKISEAQVVAPEKAGVQKELNPTRSGLDSGFRRNDGKGFLVERRQLKATPDHDTLNAVTVEKFEKAFLLLPEEVLDLFLTDRMLSVRIEPDAPLPLGMATRSTGPADARTYSIVVREEHLSWPENVFLGAFLRELGHVVAKRPPESEWPQSRGDRARFKEHLELKADAMVWRWGLRHYSMAHLAATYPEHWVAKIVEDIGKMLQEENYAF